MSVTLKTVRLTTSAPGYGGPPKPQRKAEGGPDVRDVGRDDVRSVRQPDLDDLELAIARAGCALMDREKEVSSLKSQVSSLKGLKSQISRPKSKASSGGVRRGFTIRPTGTG